MNFQQEIIKAFTIKCKAKELKRKLHALLVARTILEVIFDHDASQAETALKAETKSAEKPEPLMPLV